MPEVDFDFLIFELQQSALESEYKLKQDLLKFKYGRIKSGTSDSPSRCTSVPVAASKSSPTLSEVISSSSHSPTASSTVHFTPSTVPVCSQHVIHNPVYSTQNTHHTHVSSAQSVPHSSDIQPHKSLSAAVNSIPSDTVCSTQVSSQGLTEHSCISSGSDSDVHSVVHDSDFQSQSLHIQDIPSPSKVFPSDCHDNSSNAEPTKFSPNDSQVDISKSSSVSDIISTDEASVIGQLSVVSYGCSACSTEVPPSQKFCTTPESVVVSYQSDAEVSTHALLSNDVVMLPSHYDSFGRFYSQFCNTLCTQKTDLFSCLAVCFSTMKSVIVVLSLGFIDSDRRFLKRRRKVGI